MANKKDVINKMTKMDTPQPNKDILSKLNAGILDLIAINIGFFLICLFTLGLGWPLAVVIKEKWKCQRTYISGKKLKFVGTGGELFVEYIKWILLTIITLGIFLIWFPNKKYQWTIRHTHFEETDEKEYNSNFTGGVFDLFITNLVSFLMITFTLGIATPWAITFKKRWVESHSFIDGNQLSFSGSGIGLIGSFIKWIFFSLITLGICSFWFVLNLSKWMAKNRIISTTSIASIPVLRTIGLAMTQHKKAVVVTCIVAGLCLAGASGVAIYTNGTYRITWKNYDDTVLEIDENVPYGTLPTYDGTTPNKTGSEQYSFTFSGWSPEVNKVIGNKTYIAIFSNELQTYTVTWQNYDGTTLEVDENVPYGTLPTYDGTTPTKTSNIQYCYAFSGWSPEINSVMGNATYVAIFSENINENPIFGSYPQTKVSNSALVDQLNAAAGTLPTSANNQTWTSYQYYISGSNTTNFMWYKDITSGPDKYRGVYFTSYRPYSTSNSSSTINSFQDDNGYLISTRYWFKYEPIAWDVLSVDETGGPLVMADKILDSRDYYNSAASRTIGGTTVYANNYKESNIRTWLNDSFYNQAFSVTEQSFINTTTVDNSVTSTGYTTNTYACENTNDKIFLPSYVEATNAAYGLSTTASRIRQATDYAKALGVNVYTSKGSSYWWLRSPNDYSGNGARYVSTDGSIDYSLVRSTYLGVLPAFRINL